MFQSENCQEFGFDMVVVEKGGAWTLGFIHKSGECFSLGVKRGLVFPGRGATKMVIGDPEDVYKAQGRTGGRGKGRQGRKSEN